MHNSVWWHATKIIMSPIRSGEKEVRGWGGQTKLGQECRLCVFCVCLFVCLVCVCFRSSNSCRPTLSHELLGPGPGWDVCGSRGSAEPAPPVGSTSCWVMTRVLVPTVLGSTLLSKNMHAGFLSGFQLTQLYKQTHFLPNRACVVISERRLLRFIAKKKTDWCLFLLNLCCGISICGDLRRCLWMHRCQLFLFFILSFSRASLFNIPLLCFREHLIN